MDSRIKLHTELVEILGTTHAYYQPPESVKIEYPAIIYKKSDIINSHAGNSVYSQNNKYQIIVADKNPDSDIVKKVSKMDTCRFAKHYTSKNMNYYVFEITYDKT